MEMYVTKKKWFTIAELMAPISNPDNDMVLAGELVSLGNELKRRGVKGISVSSLKKYLPNFCYEDALKLLEEVADGSSDKEADNT